MKINRRFLNEITKRLDIVSASGRSAIEQIMLTAPTGFNFAELYDYVIANYLPIVDACTANAAAVGASAYDAFRELETGATLGAMPYSTFNASKTAGAAGAFINHACQIENMAILVDDLGRRIDSEVLRSYSNTQTENGRKDPLKPRFARVPAGDACDFCRALAGHGFYYKSAESATYTSDFNKYHDFCRCQVVPEFINGQKVTVEGYDPEALRNEWRETRQQFGKNRNRTMITGERSHAMPDIEKPLLTSTPDAVALPAKAYGGAWDQQKDMDTFLKTMFDKGEYVGTCSEFYTTRDGRRAPTKGFYQRTAGQIENVLDSTGNVAAAVGRYRLKDGAYVRVNPLDGRGISDENVLSFKYTLIECDTLPMEQQYGFVRALNLPTQAIVTSGGKSLHAVVRVDAANADQYKERVALLHAECKASGFDVDASTKNPSRYMRMPGIRRGDGRQVLVSTHEGADSWDSWRAWCDKQR